MDPMRTIHTKEWLIAAIICFFLSNSASFAEELKDAAQDESPGNDISLKEISIFKSIEKAELFAKRLVKGGYEAEVREYRTKSGMVVYGVTVLVHDGPSAGEDGNQASVTPPGEEVAVSTSGDTNDIYTDTTDYLPPGMIIPEINSGNDFDSKEDKIGDAGTSPSSSFSDMFFGHYEVADSALNSAEGESSSFAEGGQPAHVTSPVEEKPGGTAEPPKDVSITTAGNLQPAPTGAEERKAVSQDESPGNDASLKEVSVFSSKEKAELFAERLTKSGFEAEIREYKTKSGAVVYGVSVVVHGERPSAGEVGQPAGEEKPIGSPRTPKDIFTSKAGYFHLGLTVSEIYTDNAFNSSTDKKSDLSTEFSPEVWISVPRVTKRPEGVGDISTRSPGGLLLGRGISEVARRYQTYLLYRADIPMHSQNSPSGNTVSHTAQAGFVYNFPNGLSFDLSEQFLRSYEVVDSALAPGEVDKFRSNLFYATASYDTGNRLRLRLDYSNFMLRYDEQRNRPLERTDNSLSGYLYYKFKPKSSIFLQYTFIDIGYDNDATLNSKEHNFFAGLQWDITAKSKGSIKAGYGLKDFAGPGTATNNLILEAKLDHRFTPKTSLALTAFRKTDETNIPSTFYILMNGFSANYQQMITSKITASALLSYTNEDYGGELTFGGMTARRKDNVYEASPGLQYEFRKWLKSSIIYDYIRRESNFPDFSFSTNSIVFRVTGSF